MKRQAEQHLADLALDLSRRAIDAQQAVLTESRARSGTLLTATSVVVSFLGGQALRQPGFGTVAALALIAFVGSVICVLAVLWPRKEAWKFRLDARILLADFAGRDDVSASEQVAVWMQEHYDHNQAKLEGLLRLYRFAVALLAVQAVLWAVDLSNATS